MHWLQEQMGQRAENAIAEMAVWSPRSDVDGAGRGVEGMDEAEGSGVGGGAWYSPGSLSLSHLHT
jgi:hypothetical protein